MTNTFEEFNIGGNLDEVEEARRLERRRLIESDWRQEVSSLIWEQVEEEFEMFDTAVYGDLPNEHIAERVRSDKEQRARELHLQKLQREAEEKRYQDQRKKANESSV